MQSTVWLIIARWAENLCNEWADLLMKKRSVDEVTKKQVLNTIIIIAHDAALIWCVFLCEKKSGRFVNNASAFGYNLN